MARIIALDESNRRNVRLEELLREQGPKLKNLVVRMVGSRDAEDLLQEALLRVCQALPSFRSESALSTWAYRIAVNVCLSHLGRNRRRWRVEDTVELDSAQESRIAFTSLAGSPERVAENGALGEVLRDGLLALRPELRVVLVLRDVEGLSYKEAAEILGVPVGTVQSRLHKARATLRELIRSRWDGV